MSDVTLYPTLPGKAPGIVGYDPLKMQCGDCGAIHEQCTRSVGACILMAGFEFHTCETDTRGPGDNGRRCPECLVRVLSDCGAMRHDDQLKDAQSRTRRNAL